MYVNGVYTVDREITNTSDVGIAMTETIILNNVEIVIQGGKVYVILTINETDWVGDTVFTLEDGTVINYTETAISDSMKRVILELDDVVDLINVNMYVYPMFREVEYTIALLMDTLTLVEEFEYDEEVDLEDFVIEGAVLDSVTPEVPTTTEGTSTDDTTTDSTTTDSTTGESTESESPATMDTLSLGYAGLGLASLLGLKKSRKRRK